MTAMPILLLVAAAMFAVANGANDGGALVSVGLKLPYFKPWVAIGVLATAVAVVPLAIGTAVATTLATRLVTFTGARGQVALLAALVAAALVVVTLSRRGIPTSLTLAVVGGIAGAGAGSRLPVGWNSVALVVIVAATAPMLGMFLAYLATRLIGRRRSAGDVGRQLGRAHAVGFLLLCCAYAANDGQKMLAVFAVAFGTGGTVVADPVHLLVISGFFILGALMGLRRFGKRFASGVLAVRPINAVSAELSAAAAVLGSSALGAPVSMTQSVAGGLVGSGVSEGLRRVRWRVASGIVAAWVVTLPAAFLVAAALAGTAQVLL